MTWRKLINIIRKGLLNIQLMRVREYPAPKGFADDHANLVADVRAVGNDMRRAIGRHRLEDAHDAAIREPK